MDYTTTNPAVVKILLSKMNEEKFIKHAKEIKQLWITTEVTLYTMNLRSMYLNLYRWCRVFYTEKWK